MEGYEDLVPKKPPKNDYSDLVPKESKQETLSEYGEKKGKVDPNSIFGELQKGIKIGAEQVGISGQQLFAGGKVTPEQEKRVRELKIEKERLPFYGQMATYTPEVVATIPALFAAPEIATIGGLAKLLGTTGVSSALLRPVAKETKDESFIKQKAKQVAEGVKEAEEGLLLGLGIFRGIPAVGEYLGKKIVGGKTQPAITDLAKQAEKEGIILDPAQLRPVKPLGSPGLSEKTQINNENIVTRKVTKETGLESENITPAYLKERIDKFGKNYDMIFNRNFEIDKGFVDTLKQIANFEKQVAPAGSRPIIGTADNLISRWEKEAIEQQIQQMQKRITNIQRKQGPMVAGVPQSVRKDFPVLHLKGDVNAPLWMDDVTDTVNELTKNLGIAKPPRVFAGESRRPGLFGLATGDGDLIVVSSKLDREGAVATALHEFGHNVEFQMFARAPQQTQNEIMKAYLSQKASLPKGGLTTEQHRPITADKYGVGVRDLPAVGSYETYLRNFNEWFAEQTSRWITTTQAPTNTVEKFFKGIADVWKTIYARVKGSVPLVQEVDQYFRSNWKGNLINDIVPPQTFKSMGDVDLGDITAKIAGKELQRLRSNLRDVANNSTDGAVRKTASEFVTQIDGLVGKENPRLLESLIDTNRKYAATMTLSDGIEKGFVTQGKISLEGLGNYLSKNTYGYGLGTSRHPLYDAGYMGQQLKLRSRAEGTQTQPMYGASGRTRAVMDALNLGTRSPFARKFQKEISEKNE
jgi:hypothetical protein